MNTNLDTLPAGRVEVAPAAITTLTLLAVRRVPEVVGLVPRLMPDGIAQVLPWRDAHKGVEVRIHATSLAIEIYLVVAFGASIAAVAAAVQQAVRATIAQALGREDVQVYVRVQGLHKGYMRYAG